MDKKLTEPWRLFNGRKEVISLYWKKIFGELMFLRVKKYADDKNISISALVKIAVDKYIERG